MSDIFIDENFPGLCFYKQNPYQDYYVCMYDGDLITDGSIEIALSADSAGVFICTGKIQAGGYVRCGLSLAAQKGITAGAYIEGFLTLHCCTGGMRAGEFIWAGDRIDLRGDLVAGSFIDCEGIGCLNGDIRVGDCIIAKGSIGTDGNITCGKRIFAGVDLDSPKSECSNKIMCNKLLHGEICSGILEEGGDWMPENGWC